jgi:hypothetical protein
MTNPNEPVEIDVTELAAHQHRLADVVIRTGNAHEASGTPLNPDAFGAFGYFMALDCAKVISEGADTLRVAHEAAEDHHQQVGIWVADLEATEGKNAKLFRTGPVMRDG